MDKTLEQKVAESNSHRRCREDIATLVLERRELANDLISLALEVNGENHFKACWILEIVLERDLSFLAPRLSEFCDNLQNWTNDSALRSVAKICVFCARELQRQQDFLSEKQIVQITESCFRWLISDEKVATKAYAIHTLFETGKGLDWVYAELVPVLQQGFPNHSPAYRSVAKKVLFKIRKRYLSVP